MSLAQGMPGARPPTVLNAMHVHTMTDLSLQLQGSIPLVVVWLMFLVYNIHQKPFWLSDAVIGRVAVECEGLVPSVSEWTASVYCKWRTYINVLARGSLTQYAEH